MNDVSEQPTTAQSGPTNTVDVLEDISAQLADLLTTMQMTDPVQDEPGGAVVRTFTAGVARIKDVVDGSVKSAMSQAAQADSSMTADPPKSHRPVDINDLHELRRKVNSLQDLLSALAFGHDDEQALRSAVQGLFDYNGGICSEVHQLAVAAEQAR